MGNSTSTKHFKTSNNNSQFERFQEKMTTSSIEKWSMLRKVPPNLAVQIRMAAIFGHDGGEASFITDNGKAYGFGDNVTGCLGLGNENSCREPKKINGLKGLRINQLAYGYSYDYNFGVRVVALTDTGDVWTWGDISRDGLGDKQFRKNYFAPEKLFKLKGIVQVACGKSHSLALNENGIVYSWGSDYCGQLGRGKTDLDSVSPQKVVIENETRPTISIACGQSSSYALMENGEVYSWGENEEGVLGLKSSCIQLNIPTRIKSLEGINIRQVACGYSHVLALADDGSIYSWGRNFYGELGNGDKKKQNAPVKVKSAEVRFVGVAASIYQHMSVALSEDGRCWIWGKCKTGNGSDIEKILLPRMVPSASVPDAFADFGIPQVPCQSMIIRHSH